MLLVVPNRLGVEVVDDEVVALAGLPAMKENAGFVAVEESVRTIERTYHSVV